MKYPVLMLKRKISYLNIFLLFLLSLQKYWTLKLYNCNQYNYYNCTPIFCYICYETINKILERINAFVESIN